MRRFFVFTCVFGVLGVGAGWAQEPPGLGSAPEVAEASEQFQMMVADLSPMNQENANNVVAGGVGLLQPRIQAQVYQIIAKKVCEPKAKVTSADIKKLESIVSDARAKTDPMYEQYKDNVIANVGYIEPAKLIEAIETQSTVLIRITERSMDDPNEKPTDEEVDQACQEVKAFIGRNG